MGQFSMFPRAVAGCGHGISNCMREQPGETLTAQVSIIPAAATRLSYNHSGPGPERSLLPQSRCLYKCPCGWVYGSTLFRAFTLFSAGCPQVSWQRLLLKNPRIPRCCCPLDKICSQ